MIPSSIRHCASQLCSSALLDPVLALLDEVQGWVQPMIRSLSGVTVPEAANDEPKAAIETDKSAETGTPSTAVVNAFMSRLHVAVQQKSNVIQVSFKSSRPVTAASVPNTLIKLYLDQRIAEKDQALVQEREQLDNVILPAFRDKMEASERALTEYRQKSGLISDRNATVLGQELSETQGPIGHCSDAHSGSGTAPERSRADIREPWGSLRISHGSTLERAGSRA